MIMLQLIWCTCSQILDSMAYFSEVKRETRRFEKLVSVLREAEVDTGVLVSFLEFSSG